MDNLTIYYIASFGVVYLVVCWAVITFGRGSLTTTFGYLGLAVPFVGLCLFGAIWLAGRMAE
jgi:hypothetical protein